MAVVQTAHATALSMGASAKVMLALFEAAVVESNFENLNHGNDDSVGFLQQRPSQGWPNPMDVPTATRSFVSKAIPIQDRYASAGQVAQAVQRSAFPLRYDAAKAKAEALLASVGGSGIGASSAIPGAQNLGFSDSLESTGKMLEKLSRGDFWQLIGVFAAGLLLVGLAIRKQLGGTLGV
jgi:hypothetical protein